jgi:geranylgeranyl diphosphate synthase type II
MDAGTRIEQMLTRAVSRGEASGCPPLLSAAIRHSVFPGGARIRPRLCLAVAAACREDAPLVTDAAAAAIELLHCASLVHDDLPCFDDADTRRGRPSVHRAFGEPLAVLAGDALIVMAFQTLALEASIHPARLPALIATVARAVGVPTGIVAGQAWECETGVDLALYHREKTGALFTAATVAGAASAGADPDPWRALGDHLGEAYQVADDIRDLVAEASELGKPVGRDMVLGRPNVALEEGLDAALDRLDMLLAAASDSIPNCAGAPMLKSLIQSEGVRLVPKGVARRAA